MAFWKQYSSPLGYANNGNQIDSYGVDHSGFSTQDEVQYQTARINRENELMSQMNSQGVTDYPQYGTNFWGNSADNNYGFGTSNITNNIENMKSSIQQSPSNPNCYIEFNGHNVDLYKHGQTDGNRLLNGQLEYHLDGQSGQDAYQNKSSQDIPNKGPIPEGTYWANQDQRQYINLRNAGLGIINAGAWPGSLASWGLRRVWLKPDVDTNTYGRTNLSIHGGWSKGSRGCIDIPGQTKQLDTFMNQCQDSVPVYVNYPSESW